MKRWAILLSLLASSLLASCSGTGDAASFIERAQQAHQGADRLLEAGNLDGARRLLRGAVEATPPDGIQANDGRIVRQDLYYRLTEVELAASHPDRAAAWASAGLALGQATDVFTANLHIGKARALERMSDASGASREYHDALLVTEALLDRSLGGSASAP
jgi:hypothetical protein